MKNKNSLILTSIVCIIPLIAGLILLNHLPEQIPVQWGSGGTVSSYAPRWFSVFCLPAFFLLMNIYLYVKAEKSDLSMRYPESMKLFLKWSMPTLSVVSMGISYAASLNRPLTLTGISGFIGVCVTIFGFYFYGLREVPEVRRVFAASNEKADKTYSLCGVMFEVFGILAAFTSVLGFYTVSFGFLIAVFVLTFVYTNLLAKR